MVHMERNRTTDGKNDTTDWYILNSACILESTMTHTLEALRTTMDLLSDIDEKIAAFRAFIAPTYQEKPRLAVEPAMEMLALARLADRKDILAESLMYVGRCRQLMQEYIPAAEYLQESLVLYRDLSRQSHTAFVLFYLGNTYHRLGRHADALHTLQEGFLLARQNEDIALQAHILNTIGMTHGSLGNYHQAMAYYVRSLKLREEIGDNNAIGVSYTNIGNVYFWLGEYDRALEFYARRLALCHETGNTHAQAILLQNMGGIYERSGNITKALEVLLQALPLYEALQDKAGKGRTLGSIGVVYRHLGEFETSRRYHEQALQIADEIQDNHIAATTMINLGDVYRSMGRYEESVCILHDALRHVQEGGIRKLLEENFLALSISCEAMGDRHKALEYYKAYVEAKREMQEQIHNNELMELHTRLHLEQTEKDKELLRHKNEELAQALAEMESVNMRLYELNREKSDLLGLVAHDLKNPIGTIAMLAKILAREASTLSVEEIEEFLNDMEMTAAKMLEFVTELLDVNSIESGTIRLVFEPLDLVDICHSIMEAYQTRAEAKSIHLNYCVDGQVYVYADRNAITHVLDNLISNAIKYSPHGTQVSVHTYALEDTICCEVRDEGPGFTEEDKQKLFGKFMRLSARPTGGEQSTGLGLSIVKKLVDLLNGTIVCNSEKGRGSTFIVKVPHAVAG